MTLGIIRKQHKHTKLRATKKRKSFTAGICVCALCSFVTTVWTHCNNSGPRTCHQGGLIFVQANWQVFASHLEVREVVTEWDYIVMFL